MSEEIVHSHRAKHHSSLTTVMLLIPPLVFVFVIGFYLFTKALAVKGNIAVLSTSPEYILGVEDVDNSENNLLE